MATLSTCCNLENRPQYVTSNSFYFFLGVNKFVNPCLCLSWRKKTEICECDFDVSVTSKIKVERHLKKLYLNINNSLKLNSWVVQSRCSKFTRNISFERETCTHANVKTMLRRGTKIDIWWLGFSEMKCWLF